MWEGKFQTKSRKWHNRFTLQNLCILLGRVSTKVVEIVKFQTLASWAFFFFFFFCVNMWQYGSKIFKHLLWKHTPDSLDQIHVYSQRGSLPKLLKQLRYLKNWFLFFFGGGGGLTWYTMGNYKICNILKAASHTAKRTKFEPQGQLLSVSKVLFLQY